MIQVNILSPADFDAIPDAGLKLQAWYEHQQLLDKLKTVETHMRNWCFDTYFPGLRDDLKSGLKNFDLGGGWTLKGTPGVNYKIDPDALDVALTKMEKLGEEGKLLADRLVRFKPELSVSEYKKLNPTASRAQAKIKELIDGAVTATPGTPKLELAAPKVVPAT